MASNERILKRIVKLEEWVSNNEDLGGPEGTLETFNFLIAEARTHGMQRQHAEQNFGKLKYLMHEFLSEHELTTEWDDFVKLKEEEDAVQKQQTEEVPLQEEAESGEEAVEASKEEVKED